MEKNLIKGGSLENAIVIRGEAVLSKEPLRFPMNSSGTKSSISSATSRFSGSAFAATSIAVKPGHGANAELARALARECTRDLCRCSEAHAFPPGEGGLDINR